MSTQTFHSIFDKVGKAKTKKEKIDILRAHSGPVMKMILGYTYDPNVKWLLPEGTPPYKQLSDNADAGVTLQTEMKRFYLFVEGPTDTQKNLKQPRREELFIQTLESLHPDECKVLIGMKDRKLPYRGLTRKLVAEAFPNLAKNWF
jgi:hypothetical protein